MARFVSIQTNFSVGEIDPLVRARLDLQQYYNALAKATNILVLPQGGFRRRPGSKFVFEIPSAAAPENGVRLVPFEFSVDDSYMLLFVNNRMYVFKDGALVTDINGVTDQDYLVTTIGSSRLASLSWTQQADTLIVCEEGMAPKQIVRGATDADWTISDISFDSLPLYAFTITVTNPNTTLTPSAVSGTVTLTAGASVFHAGRTNTAQAGGAAAITLDAGAAATNDIYNGATITIDSGTGAGQTRIISDYDGGTLVATVSVAWTTQPDATSVFTISSQVGQYINATPQGRARIVGVTSATVVSAITEFPFFGTSAIAASSWELESGYESAWSAARGYPRSAVFHEGRLYFGGSESRPATVWGSKVGLFFDFLPDEGLDDDAVESTIEGGFNAIVDMISGRDLQIFTVGGEYFVPQSTNQPITPSNFFIKVATKNGTKPGMRVQQLESGTLYVQRQGKALQEFLFTDVELAYVSNKISLLSGHLLKSPVRMALRRATSTDEGDLLLIVNDTDGSIAAWMILRSQNVIAPAEWTTDGDYIDAAVDVSTIYTVVKRVVASADEYYVEYFDLDLMTDAAHTGGVASSVSGLPYTGVTVDILLDGTVQEQQTVSGSAVTFARASTASYEVGLPFTPLAKTMPVEPRLQSGSRVGFKKRVVEVNAMVINTQHMTIQGEEVPFRNFGSSLLDEPVEEFTGTKHVGSLLGYSDEADITISQDVPLKMTVAGLDYRVAVWGGS